MLELVVAVAENDVIGRGGRLPWHLPADLRHFKSLTVGKHVLMGRKTYESIGRALPRRSNVVMSRSASRSASRGERFVAPDCQVVESLAAAQSIAAHAPLMVIGGAELYNLCVPIAERIHLTLVHTQIDDGDTFFSGWRLPQWRQTACVRHETDEQHAFAYSFVTLERAAPHQTI